VVEMGWAGKKNGELLRLMNQEGFTILLTTDQNLGMKLFLLMIAELFLFSGDALAKRNAS
jgi:hypothetical protein